MYKEEIKKDDNYWKGYTKKQKEAEEICKMCKYRKTYKKLKQKESILDKVVDKLKEDIEIDKVEWYDGGKLKSKQFKPKYVNRKEYARELLNIIEGEE